MASPGTTTPDMAMPNQPTSKQIPPAQLSNALNEIKAMDISEVIRLAVQLGGTGSEVEDWGMTYQLFSAPFPNVRDGNGETDNGASTNVDPTDKVIYDTICRNHAKTRYGLQTTNLWRAFFSLEKLGIKVSSEQELNNTFQEFPHVRRVIQKITLVDRNGQSPDMAKDLQEYFRQYLITALMENILLQKSRKSTTRKKEVSRALPLKNQLQDLRHQLAALQQQEAEIRGKLDELYVEGQ